MRAKYLENNTPFAQAAGGYSAASTAVARETDRERTPRQVDDWKEFECRLFSDLGWWEIEEGIFDSRIRFPVAERTAEGGRLREAYRAAMWVLRRHTCEFKIGMARSLAARWVMYKSTTGWQPTHL